jgi:di/tricarboxylate transporter
VVRPGTALADLGPAVLLSTLFALVAVMTNILSNAATAVLFTPMGYQTNLLVMGPGHYKFSDYLRGGAPLAVLIWLAFSLFAPWYYGF